MSDKFERYEMKPVRPTSADRKMAESLALDPFPRETGGERFDAMSEAEQDELIGPEAAEKVRKGEASLADFVKRTAPGDTPGFITQKPVEEL